MGPMFRSARCRSFISSPANLTALYVGSTFELARRVWQHKTRAIPGFTAKYGVDRLVWFETHESLETALVRERQIKKWKRDWKINLIERENPNWADLYPSLSP